MSRIESGAILQNMGFIPFVDFVCRQTAPGSVTIQWLSAQAQPSEATLNAVVWSPAIEANALLVQDRPKLVALLTSNNAQHAKLMRALMLTILDELNLHAVKMNAILTAIDNGATVAAIKTNILAIADYPARTKANLITTLTTKINVGDADQ